MLWRIVIGIGTGIAVLQGSLFLGVVVGKILAFRNKPVTQEEEERAATGPEAGHRGRGPTTLPTSE